MLFWKVLLWRNKAVKEIPIPFFFFFILTQRYISAGKYKENDSVKSENVMLLGKEVTIMELMFLRK